MDKRVSIVKIFNRMMKDFETIKSMVKKNYPLHRLDRGDIEERTKDFLNHQYCGLSEHYYYGSPTAIDWIIGIEIFLNQPPKYIYEKVYVLGPDDIQKFDTKEQLIEFLQQKKILESIIVVENPDKQKIYHCWHYCFFHKEPFMHTQAQCDFHKRCNYTTIPMKKKTAKIDVIAKKVIRKFRVSWTSTISVEVDDAVDEDEAIDFAEGHQEEGDADNPRLDRKTVHVEEIE